MLALLLRSSLDLHNVRRNWGLPPVRLNAVGRLATDSEFVFPCDHYLPQIWWRDAASAIAAANRCALAEANVHLRRLAGGARRVSVTWVAVTKVT